MRNGMRYILILCLFLGFVSCQEDILQPSGKGKGRLVLKDVEISIEASTEVTTRATSTFTAPTASELTYKVTDTQTGEVVYNQTGEFTSLVLDEGSYRLEASYGTEIMGTTPYLYAATEEFQIITATEITKNLSVKLSCAIVHPAIADNLLEHYNTYKIEISDGTTTQEVINNADFFVTTGKDYTVTLSGTNALNEAKSDSWELKNVLIANRYTLNCNPDLPSFTLPEQVEGNVWSTFIYITPMTAANMSSKPEMAEKVLANVVYEASSDGVNWIQAINDNGKIVIKGLTPSSKDENGQVSYTIRSRFGAVICSNPQITTTEQAQQLENGDMETWDSPKISNAFGGTDIYCYYIGTQNQHSWNTYNEETTNGATNSASNYGLWWRWCSGTTPTSDVPQDESLSNNQTAAEISTLAFYTDKVANAASPYLWDRNGVYDNYVYYKSGKTGKSHIGALFTGKDEFGVQHLSRPLSISFYYKYSPCKNGDQCIIYAKIYDENKNLIATTKTFNSSKSDTYQKETLSFQYTSPLIKASYIKVMFQSGTNTDIGNMTQTKPSTYTASPYPNDRVVGSVLKIDNVVLNYDYE